MLIVSFIQRHASTVCAFAIHMMFKHSAHYSVNFYNLASFFLVLEKQTFSLLLLAVSTKKFWFCFLGCQMFHCTQMTILYFGLTHFKNFHLLLYANVMMVL